MNILRDWKWYASLAVFALFTALVVWLPAPQAKPAAVNTVASPTASPADLSSNRPAPTPDELEGMLYYTVQDDDTVFSIARLFVVSEADLRWANRMPEGSEVVAGDKIRVPAP